MGLFFSVSNAVGESKTCYSQVTLVKAFLFNLSLECLNSMDRPQVSSCFKSIEWILNQCSCVLRKSPPEPRSSTFHSGCVVKENHFASRRFT